MSPYSQKLLCRFMIEKIFNEGQFDLSEMFFAPDAVHHELEELAPHLGCATPVLASFVDLYRRGFPDLHITIIDQICDEDRVVTRFKVEGTQTGPLMSIRPSGRPICVEGIRIDRVADGRITETWSQWDAMAMLEQIGAASAVNRKPAASLAA
jgi:SnoaL-like polyketide cyclase